MASRDMALSPWWQKGVIYQIYPRSFQDTNDDGIGDLRGIITHLDYLNDGTPQSLGIDAIWISPCYPSPMADFGYDISNYTDIAPCFGTLEDFKELLAKAHQRNIKIIMDLVINHTSDQHPWFLEARSSKDNPRRDWYIWHAGQKGKPPNNWYAAFEMQSAWWWDERTREFYLGTFTRCQPEVNWRNPDLKKAMLDVIRFWLDLGVDGFRMDVVNWYVKDREFRSNPLCLQFSPPDFQNHLYDRNQPETHDICREIRQLVDQYPERMLVGEIYTGDPHVAGAYYGKGDELHLAFNFSFLFQKWDAHAFHRKIEEWNGILPPGGWPNYTLSNHDQPRHYYRYRQGKWTEARARVAAAMLLTLRGTPFLYYGEEIGMTNGHIPRRCLQDPLGKHGWPFLGRDGERTPMQWQSAPHGGFTSGAPWLPVNPDYMQKNVATQHPQAASLLSFYRELIWLRKNTPALAMGAYQALSNVPHQILAYKRFLNDEVVYVLLNFARQAQVIDLAKEIGRDNAKVILGTDKNKGETISTATLALGAYEVLLLQ